MPLQFELIDVFGETVYSQPLTNSTQSTINITGLSNGIYFYQLIGNEGIQRGKLVIQK
jgi:hypothetical protein